MYKQVAAIGLLVSILAGVLDVLNVLYFPWFASRRNKGVTDSDKAGYTFISAVVDCSNDICVKKGTNSEWQTITLYLLLVAVGSCLLSLFVQLFVFWPLVLTGRVYNAIIKMCRILDFYGSPLKFAVGFIYISHSGSINHNYSWTKENAALLQLEPLVIGVLLISYILQVLVFVALTVAVDVGPRGEVSYLEIFKLEEQAKEAEIEESLASQRSSYAPETSKEHDKILKTVKYIAQKDSYGTIV
ncbi:hypothetical protein Btru_074934 [Bulinus truncatus]|nr:hypothetical protein Btru_074934 [Bulinus truncatus]